MQTVKRSIATLCALVLSLLFSCKKQEVPQTAEAAAPESVSKKVSHGFEENDMVLFWNEKVSVVLSAPINPPATSRYFAMIQIAVHDALNSIKPKYERYALLDAREQFASADAAVASAAYYTITKLNLQGAHPVQAWYHESLSSIPDGESKEAGIALGEAAADAIMAKHTTANYQQAIQPVPVPDGDEPGEYRSTLPFSNPGLPKVKGLPLWGTVMMTFVLESSAQFRPGPPYPVNSPEYTADYNEVKRKGGRAVHTRTADEDEIGRFWWEKPSITWNRFARNLVADRKMDAWKTARLFALLHTAMVDGITSSFEAKYHYFYWRPETAIRLGDSDGNDHTTGDATWLPSVTDIPNPANPALDTYSPPIPEYPSQNAFGAAAGEVLKLFFETDKVSVDQTSPTTPGVTRHFSSISQAVREHSLSRIYAGFYFRKAALAGEEQGVKVGQYVFTHAFREGE